VCVDDHSRIAFTDIFPNEKAVSAIAFLKAAVAYYAGPGVTVERAMTDNGSATNPMPSPRSAGIWACAICAPNPTSPGPTARPSAFGGKTIHRIVFMSASLETALNEWAYARAYDNSVQRGEYLPGWTHEYNWHRPHGGIGSTTPISRLGLQGDNLLRLHS